MCDESFYTYKKLDKDNKFKVQTYVDTLLKNNKNCVNFRDKNNRTILIESIILEDYNTTISLLNEPTVDVELIDNFGYTGLNYAFKVYMSKRMPSVIEELDIIISMLLKKSDKKLVDTQIHMGLQEYLNIILTRINRNNVVLLKNNVIRFLHLLSLIKRHVKSFNIDDYYNNDLIQTVVRLLDEGVDY
jgi:hypothetical protein